MVGAVAPDPGVSDQRTHTLKGGHDGESTESNRYSVPEASSVKRLHHAGGSVLTGNALADAVLDYARALGDRHMLDVVDIPVVNDHGEYGHAQLLVGSGIELMSVTTSSKDPELVDQDTVDALVRQTAEKRALRARPFRNREVDSINEVVSAPSSFEL
jgi:hypothetical protein